MTEMEKPTDKILKVILFFAILIFILEFLASMLDAAGYTSN